MFLAVKEKKHMLKSNGSNSVRVHSSQALCFPTIVKTSGELNATSSPLFICFFFTFLFLLLTRSLGVLHSIGCVHNQRSISSVGSTRVDNRTCKKEKEKENKNIMGAARARGKGLFVPFRLYAPVVKRVDRRHKREPARLFSVPAFYSVLLNLLWRKSTISRLVSLGFYHVFISKNGSNEEWRIKVGRPNG